MPGSYRFRGFLSRIDLGRVIENDLRLRRFREHLEARLRGPTGTRRQRSQRIVEVFVRAAMDDFSTHFVDGMMHHIDEIARIRSLIHEQYQVILHVNPATGRYPAGISDNLTRLFRELESHLQALENTTPARHMEALGSQGLPLNHLQSAVDDLTHAGPPTRPSRTSSPGDTAPGTRRTRRRRRRIPNHRRPDIRNRFNFGDSFIGGEWVKSGRGELGAPGEVRTYRDQAAQQRVSRHMGDDAGHLIGDRFGAPGDEQNLSLQNWQANRYGTYKYLENRWANLLEDGNRVEVHVRDHTRAGETRPYKREVTYWVTDSNGVRTEFNETFGNFPSARQREAAQRWGQ